MKDDLCEALTLIKEYCENYTCYSCMFYKSETGCFFKYHDIPAPGETVVREHNNLRVAFHKIDW